MRIIQIDVFRFDVNATDSYIVSVTRRNRLSSYNETVLYKITLENYVVVFNVNRDHFVRMEIALSISKVVIKRYLKI